jgi:hypothetical protein
MKYEFYFLNKNHENTTQIELILSHFPVVERAYFRFCFRLDAKDIEWLPKILTKKYFFIKLH